MYFLRVYGAAVAAAVANVELIWIRMTIACRTHNAVNFFKLATESKIPCAAVRMSVV